MRKRRVDVRTQIVGNETLVLDHQSGNIHQLNVTASFIWQNCDGNTSTSEIIDGLVQRFEVSNAVAVRDVADVIEKLQQLNLLSE